MEYTDVIVNIENGIATLTINRPEAGNAFAGNTPAQFIHALNACATDDNVKVIVVTGKGKNFSAGGDINRFKMLIETKRYLEADNVRRFSKVVYAVHKCPKPVIAMVNGAAAGAGFALALACDFRVLTPRSKMVMSFVNVALCGDSSALYHLQKLLGIAKTTELMMIGEVLTGEKAMENGLVTVLAKDGKLQETTYEFANKISKKATFAIAKQKALLMEFFFDDLPGYCEREVEYMVECSHTEDFAEAVDAFLEKRPPVFKGR